MRTLYLSSAALALSAGLAQADYTLHVIHINDLHSRMEAINAFDSTCSAEDAAENKCFGGVARVATKINELRDKVIDQTAKPAAERKPTTYYSAFYNNFDANDYFVENGTYLRLRELAVNLSVPKSWMSSIGLGQLSNTRLGGS